MGPYQAFKSLKHRAGTCAKRSQLYAFTVDIYYLIVTTVVTVMLADHHLQNIVHLSGPDLAAQVQRMLEVAANKLMKKCEGDVLLTRAQLNQLANRGVLIRLLAQ